MKQKIEWYREVLELEPGSRVFFPLAGLLAEDGQLHEAVTTLKQGLLRHPDHVEARLLLVELLAQEDASSSELLVEVEHLGAVFAAYPIFWKAWSTALAANPTMHDAALAIRFFTAAMQDRPVSWAAVIQNGLQAVLAELEGRQAAKPKVSFVAHPRAAVMSVEKAAAPTAKDDMRTAQTPEPVMNDAAASASDTITGKAPPAGADAHSADNAEEKDTLVEPDEERDLPAFTGPIITFDDADGSSDDEEDAEEAFSLRTRSMAEVLAEQGDIAGALDIYKELAAAAAENEEKHSLELRIEELSRRLASGGGTAEHASADDTPSGGKEGNRLIGILESLAERLEARAR